MTCSFAQGCHRTEKRFYGFRYGLLAIIPQNFHIIFISETKVLPELC